MAPQGAKVGAGGPAAAARKRVNPKGQKQSQATRPRGASNLGKARPRKRRAERAEQARAAGEQKTQNEKVEASAADSPTKRADAEPRCLLLGPKGVGERRCGVS